MPLRDCEWWTSKMCHVKGTTGRILLVTPKMTTSGVITEKRNISHLLHAKSFRWSSAKTLAVTLEIQCLWESPLWNGHDNPLPYWPVTTPSKPNQVWAVLYLWGRSVVGWVMVGNASLTSSHFSPPQLHQLRNRGCQNSQKQLQWWDRTSRGCAKLWGLGVSLHN